MWQRLQWLRIHVLLLSLLMIRAVFGVDADFESLISRMALDDSPIPDHIPNVVHFVFVTITPIGWSEYVAVRSAAVNLKAEIINIWVPMEADFIGDMWGRVLEIPGVVLRRTEMPDSVYGHKAVALAHRSDFARLKALYSEGGIYMDTNLIALRSWDPIIFNASTRNTVLGYEHGTALCNAMIMSKPRAPFLRRWLRTYRIFLEWPKLWNFQSGTLPWLMHVLGDRDLTVLDNHAWFYPLYGEGMNTLWLGKSWWDIGRNYGVHLWHWKNVSIPDLLSKDVVREIDTPFFCAIRNLFDDFDGDGYISTPMAENANCSTVWMGGVATNSQGLFASYDFSTDTTNTKWVDSSGNHLHGWAPNGTVITHHSNKSTVRYFSAGSYAVLPVPADYDARVGTISMRINFDEYGLLSELQLFKLRIANQRELLISLLCDPSDQSTRIRFQWTEESWFSPWKEAIDWSSRKAPIVAGQFHNLTVSFDRQLRGVVLVFVDDTLVSKTLMSVLSTPRIALDTWINARHAENLDTGFRGYFSHLKMYSRALPEDGWANGPSSHIPSISYMYIVNYCFLVSIVGTLGFLRYRFRGRNLRYLCIFIARKVVKG